MTLVTSQPGPELHSSLDQRINAILSGQSRDVHSMDANDSGKLVVSASSPMKMTNSMQRQVCPLAEINEPTPRQVQTTVPPVSYIQDLVREFLAQSGYEPRTGAEKYKPMMGIAAETPTTTDLSPSIDIRGGRFLTDIASPDRERGSHHRKKRGSRRKSNDNQKHINGRLRLIASLVEAAAPEDELRRRGS